MQLIKKFLPQIIITLVICLISSLGYVKRAAVTTSAVPVEVRKVIIDPGHGEFDGGAVSQDGTGEKDINLYISQKCAGILTLMGYTVIMTRTDDTAADDIKDAGIAKRKKSDMMNRLKLINSDKSAVCVSIHLNKFTTSVPCGAQVFYGVKNPGSHKLAECIQSSIRNNLQKDNDRAVKQGTKSTYLLYNALVPMVIAECGFLSNKQDLSRLKTDEYQTKTALCIAAGINDYFNSI